MKRAEFIKQEILNMYIKCMDAHDNFLKKKQKLDKYVSKVLGYDVISSNNFDYFKRKDNSEKMEFYDIINLIENKNYDLEGN